jgi:hypothetical protein
MVTTKTVLSEEHDINTKLIVMMTYLFVDAAEEQGVDYLTHVVQVHVQRAKG